MIDKLTATFAGIYDLLDTSEQNRRLEKWVVRFATLGFLLHLLLIAVARSLPNPESGPLVGLDRNFLHAVYTPFSFILFYEVLLLVLALPRSHTSSIGKQYEIVSLIVIRGVFKDIGEFRDPVTWLSQWEAAWTVLLDMIAAMLMFLLVTGFRRVSQTVVHSQPHESLDRFVAIKKSVAVLLCVVLILLAIYNVFRWASGIIAAPQAEVGGAMDMDLFFFPAFFEFMIFTDVFLLIVSIPFFQRYEYVIRNAGFVISTVLLRISLSTPKPYDLLIGLIAMIYGLCVLGVFSYFTRVTASDLATDPEI